MKKTLIIIGICALLISMPALTAFPITKFNPTINLPEELTSIQTLPAPEYDGTFVGGLGNIYKENGEWKVDTYAYLAGVYKVGIRFNKLYGKIFNLDEEEIGEIAAYFGHKIIIGWIKGEEDKKAPIIGFLFYNEEKFLGRIMSMFGPAPHIYGEYTPN